MMAKSKKVFCIGFQKTGTKSLGHALRMLGYRVCGPVGTLDPDINTKAFEIAMRYTQTHDAFEDHPWPLIYRELDAQYPGSRFILTVRNPDKWIDSVVNHFGNYENAPDRRWVYGAGSPIGNEKLYRQKFIDHNKDVQNYFRNRTEDLLVIDLSKGDNWNKLCRFLKEEKPDKPFPHLNKKGSILSLALSHVPGIAGWCIDHYVRMRQKLLRA